MRRVLNEPLNEISQGKGASETHPALSPNDEFAGFEIFDKLLIGNVHSEVHGSYGREALGKGLEIANRVGANPYKFGFAGGSDFHDGLSTSAEEAYGGSTNGTDAQVTAPSVEEWPKTSSWPTAPTYIGADLRSDGRGAADPG